MENETILNSMQSLPPTAKNITKYHYEKVRSPTVLTRRVLDDSPIEFFIEGRDSALIDVKNIQLIVEAKIRKRNAAGALQNLEVTDNVVPYCGFMYTMWSDIQVELQHRPLYSSQKYYDLLTYLQILYSTPKSYKNSQLRNALWYQDVTDGHQEIQNDIGIAPGQVYRKTMAAGSITMYMQGRIFLECFNTGRPIPEGVTISLKFFANPPSRCIYWTDNTLNLVIELQNMYLLVPRIEPRPSILKQPAKLPWTKSVVHRFILPANTRIFGPRTITIAEKLPRRCTILLWTEAQANGARDSNRLYFQRHNIEQVLLRLNGEHMPVYEGYQLSFPNNYSELYNSLFSVLGSPDTIDVTKEMFAGGYLVFPFDLTRRHISSEFYPPSQSGALDITIKLSAGVNRPLIILAILEEERVLSVNKNREWTDDQV